jgi:hypothetical protein
VSASTLRARPTPTTTSPTPRVQVPRHVTRLVTRLVVDYSAYAARPGASACRAARHVTRRAVRRAARRRLLRLRYVSGGLGTSHGSSRGSSSTTSPRAGSSSTTSPMQRVRVPRHVARLVTRLIVDYSAYAVRPGALARHAAHHAARRRLLRLRRASGCLGMSRGSSRGSSRRSSSTTSSTPCVRVPRHIARLITRLVIDYFAYAARPNASARRVARHTARRRLHRAPRLRLTATLALVQPHGASRLLASRQHWWLNGIKCGPHGGKRSKTSRGQESVQRTS